MKNTAFHSVAFIGRIENKPCRKGVYSRAKCNAIERAMAYTSIMLSQRGRVNRDSLDDNAFMALSISMTTRIESDTVDADLA